MRLNKRRSRISKLLILIVAVTTVCWDIAVSTLSVEPGTFKLESEFDAVTGTTALVGIVTSDYPELSDPSASDAILRIWQQVTQHATREVALGPLGVDYAVMKYRELAAQNGNQSPPATQAASEGSTM